MQSAILTMALILPAAALADSAAGIKWTPPSAWKQDAAKPMRVATYSIPAAKGDTEPAECAVFYFGPGQGGSVDANVQRWVAQFETPDGKPVPNPAAKKGKINNLAVTRLGLRGTYLASAGPMAPVSVKKPGYRLLGAIVEAPAGPVFFKLTEPEDRRSRAGRLRKDVELYDARMNGTKSFFSSTSCTIRLLKP